MKPGIPWSVKGIEPEVREAAKDAARRAGMTLGEWLNTVILDQSDDEQPANSPHAEISSETIPEGEMEHPQPHHPENTIRLEDIAHQLSQLAQRERESATILAYDAPRGHDPDRATMNRILARIDSNEQQAVEAFTAVNERLSVLGQQIAAAAKPHSLERPEDVPGYSALEAAIRNVVEHIEVSEKRTRDSLKSMQDRLGEMAERASHTDADGVVRAAPAFAGLESRIAEMANRLQQSENMLHSGIPDVVRNEISQLADRIEHVRQSAEELATHAQTSAVDVARSELGEIEARILGVLKDAQATIGGGQTTADDLERLRSEIGGLSQRIHDVNESTANESDMHALRVAVEQLSTRVAQGPDLRPVAEMDRRLAELNQKIEQNHKAVRSLPEFGELERRIAELDQRLEEAVRLQGDEQAIVSLEQQIAAVSDRVGHTEQQLGNLETMERSIKQLFETLEQNQELAGQTAEDAATRAVERMFAAQQEAGPSPEIRALQDGLRAVRESAAGAEQRNQETLEAVHETLEQIVNKLAELETATAGQQLAANMAQDAMGEAPGWQAASVTGGTPERQQQAHDDQTAGFDKPHAAAESTEVPEETGDPGNPEADLAASARPEAMADFAASESSVVAGDDDFIAAARRAAQAAASRPGILHPDVKPPMKAGANNKFSFALPFKKNKRKLTKPVTYTGGKPVVDPSIAARKKSQRKKLVLAGIVLLAAVSAFAFNMLAKQPKQIKQSTVIETPQKSSLAAQRKMSAILAPPSRSQSLFSVGQKQSHLQGNQISDPLVTGSLPVTKTDATLTSIVAEPGSTTSFAKMPPPEAGPLALREAAAKGDAKAQFIIASRYLDGQSVAQDLPRAAEWYQRAAAHGLAPAQYRLATLFERGKGVPQDVAAALLWYERAAEGGNVKAMHNAAVIAAGNQAGTPDYDKAFKWFKLAAEHGLHDSQFNLAVLYERGLGSKIDNPEAYFWYSLAAKQGDVDAKKRAAGIVGLLDDETVAATATRVEGWTAAPTLEDANVVAITNPVWNNTAEQPAPAPKPQSAATPVVENPVVEAQALLSGLGFNVGTPDGRMGSRTANAIRLFQLQSGMRVTGEVTPELLNVMRAQSS